jgi:hypothetical protein
MKIKKIKSKEVREEAIRLAKKYHPHMGFNDIKNLDLDDYFYWEDSPQGYDFWLSLYGGKTPNSPDLKLPNTTWEESLNFTGEIEATPATPESVQPDNKYLQISTISMRDYFAAQAMPALISSGFRGFDLVAEKAYVMADEMIKARKK